MNALKGAVIAVTSSLLVAVLFAYLFRVPIPMAGSYSCRDLEKKDYLLRW